MDIKELLKDEYREDMTLKELSEILDDIVIPDEKEVYKLKKALTKSNSEAASYKKQLQEKLSDDENRRLEEEQERKNLEEKYNKLLFETEVAKKKADLIELGYNKKLATDTATALVKGDIDIVLQNYKIHLEQVEKKIKADTLSDTPKPETLNNTRVITKEDLKKMTLDERYNFSMEHPEEYKEIYKGD